jgi:hypothetical protein
VSQATCRGGSFAVESVAAFAWNGWQASSGISGNLGLEYAHPTETLSAIKTVFEKLPGPAYSVNIENFQSWVNHEF